MKLTSYMQSAQALGTTVELRLVGTSKIKAEEYFALLWNYVAEFEDRFSRFRRDSEINKVNFSSGESIKVSPEFVELSKKSLVLSEITQGAYNPFILPALQKAGYLRSMRAGAAKTEVIDFTNREIVDADQLVVGDSWVAIPENSALDFGGIGKGYLADRLNDLIGSEFVGHFFSVGGDINAGGRDESGEFWRIDVQSAGYGKNITISLRRTDDGDFGLATSGLLHTRGFTKQPHIVDPVRGETIDGDILMCTVLAAEATVADVLAACVLLEGESLAIAMLESKSIEGVLIQYENKAPVDVASTFDVQYKHKRGHNA